MIQLTANEIYTYTPSTDSVIQVNENVRVEFQTDETEVLWGNIKKDEKINVPAGSTMYFRCKVSTRLAEIRL